MSKSEDRITRNFFKTIRTMEKSRLIKEQYENEIKQESELLEDAIKANVEGKNYNIVNNYVFYRGVIRNIGGEIEFTFSTESKDSLTISCTDLQIDDKIIEVINQLKAYFDNWYERKISEN